ncbi:MAG: MBOAT family protein [Hyphomonadaceae bacterium]
MLFVEFRFLIFFAIVFALAWLLPKNGQRKTVLTVASYVFYAAWDWRFLALIWFVTGVCYVVGMRVGESSPLSDGAKRVWIAVGVTVSLAVLGLFKYFNFFADSFADLAHLMGLPAGHVTLNLVLPVGVSFYTFQAISYMVDVYRRDIRADRSLMDVSFYIAFFPQLVAGPIVRASDFIPQMESLRRWSDVDVKACAVLFLIGYIKKAGVSDNIAPYVDMMFASPGDFSALSVIGGVLLYGVQIYCDFSGYSDMAIACAGLLGYKFPPNFDSPYLSPNIQVFWRRWHISLSSWLRDYLYIPLGGNRRGAMRRDINMMTTMLLGGLWHGASFNFVIWGGLHGLALTIERTWKTHVASRFPKMGFIGPVIGVAVTFYFVNFAWIFFRAADLSEALKIARVYLTFQSEGAQTLPLPVWPLLAGLASVHALANHMKWEEVVRGLKPVPLALALGAAGAIALAFVPTGYRPFVYFQF